MSDKNDIVIDELKKISENQNTLSSNVNNMDKKLSLHIQKTEFELGRINELDNQQNKILDKHIEGVNTLKELLQLQREEVDLRFKQHEGRIIDLETPKKAFGYIVKIAGGIAAIAGAIYGIMQLI